MSLLRETCAVLHHQISERPCQPHICGSSRLFMQVEMSTRSTNRSFKKLITERDDVSPDDIYQALCKQEVELVFTAHPTQVWSTCTPSCPAPDTVLPASACNQMTRQLLQCDIKLSLLAGSAWIFAQEICQDPQ